jgi:Subtilase family
MTMFRRVILRTGTVAVISTSLIVSSFAQATQPNQNYDRLKKLLDEKFTPPKADDKKPPVVDKKDLHWIGPKQNTPQDKKGDLSPTDGPTYRLVANRNGGLKFVVSDAGDQTTPYSPLRVQRTMSAGEMQFAQRAPVAKRNSFVIQLKPNATEVQIRALIAKYNLVLVDLRSEFGILRVERKAAPAGSGETEKLSDILNPPFVQQLRREPIVAAVTVDSTVSKPSIPRASNMSIGGVEGTISWNWGTISSTILSAAGIVSTTPAVPSPQSDGNWGMKAIRMPPVWTILQRYRDANPNLVRPRVAIVDTGFAVHEDLTIALQASPNLSQGLAVTTGAGNCGNAHGNHVAGIMGATHGNGIGVDGVIPLARIDAVPWQDTLVGSDDPGATSQDSRTTFFTEALFALIDYIASADAGDLRVVNVSLGYNFGARPVAEGDPDKIPGLSEHISAQAVMFTSLAKKYENWVLFVTAAGNDSTGRGLTPYDAKWSSPIAWAATQLAASRRPKNVLIVEGIDRSGQRADFSNIGGDVAAPGVDILSTLWMGDSPYGACPGTSMASPHVAGVAALLFELDPTKKPVDIATVIKTSAFKPIVIPGGPPRPPGAPRLDALEAALKLSPENLIRLADLNRDGKVDIEDMKIFANQMAAITENRKSGATFTEDLNGDGRGRRQ